MGPVFALILLQIAVQVNGKCRSIDRNIGCPYPWRAWHDHCYLGVNNMSPNSGHSESHCQGLSDSERPAHLVSITSEEENQFLGDYTAVLQISGFWTGYRYNGGFSWTDGSANNGFSNWADGQPNSGIRIGANCLIVYSERWSLQYCTNPRNFVCKMARIA